MVLDVGSRFLRVYLAAVQVLASTLAADEVVLAMLVVTMVVPVSRSRALRSVEECSSRVLACHVEAVEVQDRVELDVVDEVGIIMRDRRGRMRVVMDLMAGEVMGRE